MGDRNRTCAHRSGVSRPRKVRRWVFFSPNSEVWTRPRRISEDEHEEEFPISEFRFSPQRSEIWYGIRAKEASRRATPVARERNPTTCAGTRSRPSRFTYTKRLPYSRRSIIYPTVTREIPGLRMLGP